ncbi:MAG: hypothetical protein K0R00_2618 [Herbinix sp.]|nr:hypothetical protein [Herbinix sp.]
MYGITAFINTVTIQPQKQFGFLDKKTPSNFGSYVLVDGLIDTEDNITPFNSMQEELIFLGSREGICNKLTHLMVELVLHIISVDYPNFNEKVVIYVSDKEAVADYSSKSEELAKHYGYEDVLVEHTPNDRNLFTAAMLKSPVFLTTNEAERIYIKHMAMVKSVGTVKTTKAKQIQALSAENAELKLKLRKTVEITRYYQNKCSQEAA